LSSQPEAVGKSQNLVFGAAGAYRAKRALLVLFHCALHHQRHSAAGSLHLLQSYAADLLLLVR